MKVTDTTGPKSMMERMMRSTDEEMVAMDAAVDELRSKRSRLLDMVLEQVTPTSLTNSEGTGVQLAAMAFRGLNDAEKSFATTAGLKLRMTEQQSNSKAAEAIVTMLRDGFSVGAIPADYSPGVIDAEMIAEFSPDIKPGELREDNRDYSDPV